MRNLCGLPQPTEAQRSGFAISKLRFRLRLAYMEIGSSNDPGWLSCGFNFYDNNADYA